MDAKFTYENTAIIIAKYKEDDKWTNKLNKFKNVFIYEKENNEKEPYNIPKIKVVKLPHILDL